MQGCPISESFRNGEGEAIGEGVYNTFGIGSSPSRSVHRQDRAAAKVELTSTLMKDKLN